MVQPRFKAGDADAWRMQMMHFFCRCVESAASEQIGRIREACDLFGQLPVELSPEEVGLAQLTRTEAQRVEAFLLSGAAESAALALLNRSGGFMISRGSNGSHLATVVLPGQAHEYSATGETVALALLAAQTAALLSEAGLLDDVSADTPSQARIERKPAAGK